MDPKYSLPSLDIMNETAVVYSNSTSADYNPFAPLSPTTYSLGRSSRHPFSYPHDASPIPQIRIGNAATDYGSKPDQYLPPFSAHGLPPEASSYLSKYSSVESDYTGRQLGIPKVQRRPPRKLTTREEAKFECGIKGCDKLFKRSYNFKAHMETHNDKREYPFRCTVLDCNKKFVRKTDLQRHNQSVHMKEKNHRCGYCGQTFARKDTLQRHMQDNCSKSFNPATLDLSTKDYNAHRTWARTLDSTRGHLTAPKLPLNSQIGSGQQ